MYIYKNALKNIKRNIGRNILIAVIIFVIIVTTVVALTINNTSSAVIEDYRNRFGSEVRITADIQGMVGNMGGMGRMFGGGFDRNALRGSANQMQMSSDLMLLLAESDMLQGIDATARVFANSEVIRAIDQAEEGAEIDAGDVPGGFGGMFGGRGAQNLLGMGNMGNFNLLGDDWSAFGDGTRTLLDDGRFPENHGEAVISFELADENNLSVGDNITFILSMSHEITDNMDTRSWVDGYTFNLNGVAYTVSEPSEGRFALRREALLELTITGIFLDISPEYANDFLSGIAALNNRNEIHTTAETLLNVREPGETNVTLNVTYFLRSPDLLDEFESFARANGLSDAFIVSTDMASYEIIVRPVVGMQNISFTFIIIILLLGAAILILLTSIAVRERKYEIGVLRAMGMKKKKVATGLIAELFMITAVCLVLGIGVGSVAAQPVADILIRQQAEAASPTVEEQNPMGGMFGGMGGRGGMRGGMGGMGGLFGQTQTQEQAQPLDEININIGINSILQIIGIALLLSALAGLAAVSRITKYEPMKILMERN